MTPTNTQGSEQPRAEKVLMAAIREARRDPSKRASDIARPVKAAYAALIKSDREADYLSRFSYVDWDTGDDDKLRMGDFINCNHQEPVNGIERNFEGQIVAHYANGLPVILYNLDHKEPDNSGEFADLASLMMDGWEFSRLAQLSNGENHIGVHTKMVEEDSNHA